MNYLEKKGLMLCVRKASRGIGLFGVHVWIGREKWGFDEKGDTKGGGK